MVTPRVLIEGGRCVGAGLEERSIRSKSKESCRGKDVCELEEEKEEAEEENVSISKGDG